MVKFVDTPGKPERKRSVRTRGVAAALMIVVIAIAAWIGKPATASEGPQEARTSAILTEMVAEYEAAKGADDGWVTEYVLAPVAEVIEEEKRFTISWPRAILVAVAAFGLLLWIRT